MNISEEVLYGHKTRCLLLSTVHWRAVLPRRAPSF